MYINLPQQNFIFIFIALFIAIIIVYLTSGAAITVIPSPGPYLFEEPQQELYQRNVFKPSFPVTISTSDSGSQLLGLSAGFPSLTIADLAYDHTFSSADKSYHHQDQSMAMTEANRKYEDEMTTSPSSSQRSDQQIAVKENNIVNYNIRNIDPIQLHDRRDKERGGHRDVNLVQKQMHGHRDRHNNSNSHRSYLSNIHSNNHSSQHGNNHSSQHGNKHGNNHSNINPFDMRHRQDNPFHGKDQSMDDEVDDMSSVDSEPDYGMAPLLRS